MYVGSQRISNGDTAEEVPLQLLQGKESSTPLFIFDIEMLKNIRSLQDGTGDGGRGSAVVGDLLKLKHGCLSGGGRRIASDHRDVPALVGGTPLVRDTVEGWVSRGAGPA